jgi:hypothetical protein
MNASATGQEPSIDRMIRFGEVALSEEAEAFRREMSHELIGLMRSLPGATHADAAVFFMQDLGIPFIPVFDFFGPYVAPAWSILYWLEQHPAIAPSLKTEDRNHARTAHSMALFLHLLDDHLNDGQLPATHLNLLLRSQAWLKMNAAVTHLSAGVDGGAEIVRGFIEAYYASIGAPPPADTLDGYCRHFRHQMATGMIVPVLLAIKLTGDEGFSIALEEAYGAFGIAWRLLDDLQDLEADMRTGSHSGIYFALPPEIQPLWGQMSQVAELLAAIARRGIRETLEERISLELASAAATLEKIQMTGLAEECRSLARPFKDRSTPSSEAMP